MLLLSQAKQMNACTICPEQEQERACFYIEMTVLRALYHVSVLAYVQRIHVRMHDRHICALHRHVSL